MVGLVSAFIRNNLIWKTCNVFGTELHPKISGTWRGLEIFNQIVAQLCVCRIALHPVACLHFYLYPRKLQIFQFILSKISFIPLWKVFFTNSFFWNCISSINSKIKMRSKWKICNKKAKNHITTQLSYPFPLCPFDPAKIIFQSFDHIDTNKIKLWWPPQPLLFAAQINEQNCRQYSHYSFFNHF